MVMILDTLSFDPINEKIEEALFAVVTGVNDPDNHYMINANYYERDGVKVYLAAFYLHRDACWNLVLEPKALSFEVLVNRSDPKQRYIVRIAYDQIWQVLARQEDPFFSNEDQIFCDLSVIEKQAIDP